MSVKIREENGKLIFAELGDEHQLFKNFMFVELEGAYNSTSDSYEMPSFISVLQAREIINYLTEFQKSFPPRKEVGTGRVPEYEEFKVSAVLAEMFVKKMGNMFDMIFSKYEPLEGFLVGSKNPFLRYEFCVFIGHIKQSNYPIYYDFTTTQRLVSTHEKAISTAFKELKKSLTDRDPYPVFYDKVIKKYTYTKILYTELLLEHEEEVEIAKSQEIALTISGPKIGR